MAAINHPALPIAAEPRRAFVARIAGVVANTLRIWRNRSAMRRLTELSDWELADIGLERDDLFVAYEGPLGGDPTQTLQRIARDRARAEYAARQVS